MSKRTRGRKYPRRTHWISQRNKSFERAGVDCEVSGESLLKLTFVDGDREKPKLIYKRACHHVIAERFARLFVRGCDPHCDGNLVTITASLHAKVTAAERRLHRADIIGYKSELNKLGFPPELFDKALKALCDSVKKKTCIAN